MKTKVAKHILEVNQHNKSLENSLFVPSSYGVILSDKLKVYSLYNEYIKPKEIIRFNVNYNVNLLETSRIITCGVVSIKSKKEKALIHALNPYDLSLLLKEVLYNIDDYFRINLYINKDLARKQDKKGMDYLNVLNFLNKDISLFNISYHTIILI